MKKVFKCWDVSRDESKVMFKLDCKKDVKVGIRYTLVYDGVSEFLRTKIFPYSEDVVLHDWATVSVPANWNDADIRENLFLTGKKLYYYDNSARIVCAGEIES